MRTEACTGKSFCRSEHGLWVSSVFLYYWKGSRSCFYYIHNRLCSLFSVGSVTSFTIIFLKLKSIFCTRDQKIMAWTRTSETAAGRLPACRLSLWFTETPVGSWSFELFYCFRRGRCIRDLMSFSLWEQKVIRKSKWLTGDETVIFMAPVVTFTFTLQTHTESFLQF